MFSKIGGRAGNSPACAIASGTVTPAALMVAMAHAAGAKVLVDGAQSVSHMRTDVVAFDAGWFVFSGHKVFGPTGIGALYGKKYILDEMPPYQSGGNMIADVTFEKIRYQPPPFLFEAGTGNIADAVGLGAALAYVAELGMEHVAAHEHALIEDCVRQLTPISGVRIIGNPTERAGVVSFVIDGLKTEDVGKALGHFRLEDDEALVAVFTPGGAGYAAFTATNIWGITPDAARYQNSLNTHQADINLDGTITFVVANRDPGVFNWIDPGGN